MWTWRPLMNDSDGWQYFWRGRSAGGLHGQWSVTSAALTFPSSEQMPTCSPLSSRLIWLIFTELWGHTISRHPFLEAANIFGGGGQKLHAQPQPTKWTPEMVKSERERWKILILHWQQPQFRATNLLFSSYSVLLKINYEASWINMLNWTFFLHEGFNNSGQNVDTDTLNVKSVNTRVSLYSQFQTSELYFPGCPAKRPFRNVYLKPGTGEGQ